MPPSAANGSALAARCTACGTVFRVVPDQLRVSDGWVRCGRCAQVFNAAQTLIDLETGAPRSLEPSSRPAGAAAPAMAPPAPSGPPAQSAPPAPPAPSAPPPPAEAARTAFDSADAATTPAAALATDDPRGTSPAAMPAVMPASVPASGGATPPAAPAAAAATVPGSAAAGQPATPSFLRQAERAARWRQPRVRVALGLGCVLAAMTLAAQAAHTWRDQAAARHPSLRPLLQAGCQVLGCVVGPVRAIESLTVESSALLRVEQSSLYQLTVSLRNRSTLDLAVPALELSMTDSQGRLLARRVLRAAELGAPQPTLAAGRDLALQATLQTAPQSTPSASAPAVAGYTIELFYP